MLKNFLCKNRKEYRDTRSTVSLNVEFDTENLTAISRSDRLFVNFGDAEHEDRFTGVTGMTLHVPTMETQMEQTYYHLAITRTYTREEGRHKPEGLPSKLVKTNTKPGVETAEKLHYPTGVISISLGAY